MPEADNLNRSFKEENNEVSNRNVPERDILSWVAPARPFKRRDKKFYVTLIAMASIVGLVLFLIEGWVPVVLIVSLIFLFYVMSTVPPEDIEYKLTTKGVKIAERRTDWNQLGRFWFTRRFDNELLIVETFRIPGRLELIIDKSKKEDIQREMSGYLVHEEVPPSGMDKAVIWLTKKLPGNN